MYDSAEGESPPWLHGWLELCTSGRPDITSTPLHGWYPFFPVVFVGIGRSFIGGYVSSINYENDVVSTNEWSANANKTSINKIYCVSNIGSSWGWGPIVVSCLRPCDEVGHYMAWEGHHCWLAMQHAAQVPSRPGSTFLFALVASCCAWLVGHLWCVPALCALNWARVFCCPDDLYVSCFLPHWLSICSSFPILDSGLIPKMMTSRWSTGSRHAMILGIGNQKRAAVDSICTHNGVCLGAQLIQVCTCTGFKFIDPMTNNNVNC